MPQRKERRSAPRFTGFEGKLEFGYPGPSDHPCAMQVRDISVSGISFTISEELPGLEVGRILEGATIRIGRRVIRGDLVVMHLTSPEPDALCGALFYPQRDADILKLRALIAELDQGSFARSA